jgi:hypothetical protein
MVVVMLETLIKLLVLISDPPNLATVLRQLSLLLFRIDDA